NGFFIVSRADRFIYVCSSHIVNGVAENWNCDQITDADKTGGVMAAGDQDPAWEFHLKNRTLPYLSFIRAAFPLSATKLPESIGRKTSILSIPNRGPARWIE